jgi:dinuclear metal center YbgI/SA1388 family protein
MAAPSLAEVADILHEIAPLELAAEWDNVGMLLQPNARPPRVQRALLAVDLTVAVVADAVAAKAQLVVAYHPPIFHGWKRLHADGGVQEAVLRAAAAGVAVYSPHTALDAAPSGLADWLVESVLAGDVPKELRPCGDGEFGRLVVLAKALPLRTLLQRCKRRFGVRTLQLARPAKAKAKAAVRSIAVAAGAGGAVLRGAAADVLVTGEMSHHDVLAAVAAGRSVVLAGHSNTERGFLKVLQRRLRAAFAGDLDVRISKADRDPLVVA